MDNAVITQTVEPNVDAKKKRKEKVRSAWISFAGRIVAQLVGAIATVALGVMVLHRYTSGEERPGPSSAPVAVEARPAESAQQPAVHVIVLTPAMLGAHDGSATADRPCTARLDAPKTAAAHFDHGTLLSR